MRSLTDLHADKVGAEADVSGLGLDKKADLSPCEPAVLLWDCFAAPKGTVMGDVLRIDSAFLFLGGGVSCPADENAVILTARVSTTTGSIASVPRPGREHDLVAETS